MTRVHLVYPHEDRISCPDAIGRHLAEHLTNAHDLALYDWDDTQVIEPGAGDILLGHPHPSPWTTFRRSLKNPGWARRLVLAPFNHGDPRQSAWLDPVIRNCDLFLAITGEHWFTTASSSVFSHWVPKMVHMDLAVDRNDFPPIKTSFNPPGRRRFLFIGHSHWTKNVGYLSRIALGLEPGTISWMGLGRSIPGVVGLGLQDFRLDGAKALVAEHDFLLSVGHADANPAAVLEAMAWGLIPACTIESAHADLPGIVRLPLNDERDAIRILNELQEIPEPSLTHMQEQNGAALDDRFTWARFTGRVDAAVASAESPDLLTSPLRDRLTLTACRLTSPYGWWRPSNLRTRLRRSFRRG